nr:hypothetical protein Iba_chr02eCG3820 [Ipomoea batatas]
MGGSVDDITHHGFHAPQDANPRFFAASCGVATQKRCFISFVSFRNPKGRTIKQPRQNVMKRRFFLLNKEKGKTENGWELGAVSERSIQTGHILVAR